MDLTNLPPEQEAIRAKCFHPTGTFVEFAKEEIEQSIPERFEKIVRRYPDRIAIKMEGSALTYDSLNKSANCIAWALHNRLDERIEPVLLLCRYGLGSAVSCLGVLKAGKILAVGNPSSPTERIAHVLENSQAIAIVTDKYNRDLARELSKDQQQVINIDALEYDLPDENLALKIPPDAVAQIVYSSGSTGQPKGIFFDHRRVLHDIMTDINASHICPDDRLITVKGLSFGAGPKILFKALLSGAAIFLYDVKSEGLFNLAAFLTRERITICRLGASVFRNFVNQLSGTEQFPLIRMITLGGQTIAHRDIAAYKKTFSERCVLRHHLSSSEAGTLCYYFIDKQTEISGANIPVGYSVENKKILLLDENGNEANLGDVGEIAVRSRYLSAGYWRSDVLTGARFLADPLGGDERICLTGDLGRMLADGCLIHLGRKDFVVKIRGFRVEIGEVERALLSHPQVNQAGVKVWEREDGEKYLAAYIALRKGYRPGVDELRNFLIEKLPDYMVPSAFVFLDDLPLTNGKLDRKGLPEPENKRPELNQPYASPRNDVEHNLVQIWQEILQVNPIGINDHFFDLGGHSLAATRVVSQVVKKFRLEIPLQSLFRSPSVAEMAAVIMEHQAKDLGEGEVDRMFAELESLSDDEAQRLLHSERGTERR
jgi:non-ribosomal peptide synthetase component F/acyl carrier protein